MLACAALFCSPGAAQEWWQLGGQLGVSPADVADFSLMIDDAAASQALQPFELNPSENILPQLGPWQRWRFPTDPQFRSGHPRFWTDINHNTLYKATEIFLFVDGDLTTYVERRDDEADFLYHRLGHSSARRALRLFPPEGISPESDEPFRPNYILNSL